MPILKKRAINYYATEITSLPLTFRGLNHSLFPFYVLVSLQYTCIDNQNNHCNCFSSHKIYYMYLFTRLFSQNIYEEYRLPLLHDVSNLLCIMNIFCKISNTENLKFAGKLSHSMP